MTDNSNHPVPTSEEGDDRGEPQMTGIQMAVKAAGSQRALAGLLDPGPQSKRDKVSEQAVGQWVQDGFVTQARAIEINKLFPHVPIRLLLDPKLIALIDLN